MEFLAQLRSLEKVVSNATLPAPRFNPRPPGVIREGSASDAVLKILAESPGFKTEAQLMWITKRSHSAISWACLFLKRHGLIEERPDTTRNSRYLKYRIKKE